MTIRVSVKRTAGDVSARCHDEEANSLPLNLMHDIVTGTKTPEEARKGDDEGEG